MGIEEISKVLDGGLLVLYFNKGMSLFFYLNIFLKNQFIIKYFLCQYLESKRPLNSLFAYFLPASCCSHYNFAAKKIMLPLIRRISVNDAEALAKLSRLTFFDTFTGTCTDKDMEDFLDQTFNLSRLKDELADEANLYYFAELDGEPVAYIQMKEDYSGLEMIKQWKALELKRIYIDKPFHGHGIAQMLLQFVENYARGNHYEVLWLGVWEHNLRAKKFYEKSGFKDTGVVHDFPIGDTPQTDNYLWKFLN